MTGVKTVIDELEEAISGHGIGYRADKLRRISDLFLNGPSDYSEREVAVFDDVMMRLVDEMEVSMRAALADRFATIVNAPQNLMRRLAADGSIDVAGPVLAKSARLDDDNLVESAKTRSQEHLLAISRRSSLSEVVTDVLVERGDRAVALSAVGNAGARFSESGRTRLVERSQDDGELAAGVWSRTDIPRHHLLKLFTAASENVRRTLELADRHKTGFIRDIVADVSNQIQARLRARSHDYLAAQAAVGVLHAAGELDELAVAQFAAAGAFDETTVALSILCRLPIGAIERAMVQDRSELVLLLAKAIGLSWPTTRAILALRAGPGGLSPHAREDSLANFTRLQPETARKALQFLRLRERAALTPVEVAD